MVNFRFHLEKGNLSKKKRVKKRKPERNNSSRAKKRRKLEEKSILDPKVFNQDEIQDSNQLVVMPGGEKSVKKKKKKKKRLSRKQRKKLEKLELKKKETKETQEYFSVIKEKKLSETDSRLMIPTSRVGKSLTAKEKMMRAVSFQEANLEIPSDCKSSFVKQKLRKSDKNMTEEGINELYYLREKKPTIESEMEMKSPPESEIEVKVPIPEEKVSNEVPEVVEEKESEIVEVKAPEDKKEEEKESKSPPSWNLTFNFQNPKPSLDADNDVIMEDKPTVAVDRKEFKESSIQEMLTKTLQFPHNKPSTTKYFVKVSRRRDIEKHRESLPIVKVEQEIIETLINDDVMIICGETGSGKTTQIPQFLYENGFGQKGMICMTQPRRVAAVSMARRVAEELNESGFGGLVGVHIRHFKKFSTERTKIKFVTDGLLLKEIQSDVLLLRYSVVVLDEAHERNANTDILIGWLSRILPLRNSKCGQVAPNGTVITKLKLVIMSATLRVSDFTENSRLFPTRIPPVMRIESRQYPVTVHFDKTTTLTDYVAAAEKKCVKIHEKLPDGGILVFLTGRMEIETLVHALRSYSRKRRKERKTAGEAIKRLEVVAKELDAMGDDEVLRMEEEKINAMGSLDDNDQKDHDDHDQDDDGCVLFPNNITSGELIKSGIDELRARSRSISSDLFVLPLYSKLPPKEQFKVFKRIPRNSRLCVVATNVAETSITIPGIRYVVDCGREKVKEYEKVSGASYFKVRFVSKASADQRAGRAGRTCPGHCYRLFSSAVYMKNMKAFARPDIRRMPVDNIVLQMKSMDINNIMNFPFPTPPNFKDLDDAVRRLLNLKALNFVGGGDDSLVTRISDLGRRINEYPIQPRYGKMILLSQNTDIYEYVLAIVSYMSVGEVFVSYDQKTMRQMWFAGASDLLCYLKVIGAYLFNYYDNGDEFCVNNNLNVKCMREIAKLFKQLKWIFFKKVKKLNNSNNKEELIKENEVFLKNLKMLPPTQVQQLRIRQVLCAGFVDQFAKRVSNEGELQKMKVSEKISETNMPYLTYKLGENVPVFIHPNSFLHGMNPEYVVYQEIVKSRKDKYYMKGVTAVQPSWIKFDEIKY